MTTFDPTQYKKVEREVYSAAADTYEQCGSKAFEAYAQPLLEAAGLVPGIHLLDVACGPGIPSLMAALLVAPAGTVTGLDLAPGMVALATKKATEMELENVRFQEGDGESLPFPDGQFDRVLCNHGLVHMTDRPKALQEMRRTLKKDGIIALSVWSTPDRSLPIGIAAKAIRELWPQAVQPGAPMWFDFGPEGALEGALSHAGFRDIITKQFVIPLVVESAEAYWGCLLGISGRLQMLLAAIPEEVALNIRSTVMKAAENFRSGEQISIPCEEVIGIAKK